MDKLKLRFEEQERHDREQFEDFVQKSHDSNYLSNLKIMKFRMYQYKELLKLYALNYRQPIFADTRASMMAFMFLPGIVSIGFNFVSPFSIFRRIIVLSTFCGTFGSFLFSLKSELLDIGKSDETTLGHQVRYRFSQLAAYDKLQMSFREQIRTMNQKE
jgi:hypothetical protein